MSNEEFDLQMAAVEQAAKVALYVHELETKLAAARERLTELEDENKMLWAWSGEAFRLFYEMHTTRTSNLTDIAVAVHTAPLRLRRRPQPQDGQP